MALLFAAVSSAAVYAEVQAAEIIQSSDFAVEPHFQGAVQLPIQEARVVAATDLRVVTSLNDLQQIIHEEMQNFTTTFQVQYKGNTQQLKSEIMNLFTEIKENDDYLLGTVLSNGYSYKGYENDVTLTINLGYTTTAEQEAYVKSEVKRLVGELITPSMSDVEKVKVINEYIVKKTTYSKNTQASPHAAYTILAEGKGVCQAYATLAYMMLIEAGMEAHYITGFAREPHAWNLVKVDGEWYHLDSTWNDPTFSTTYPELAEYISYDYFLISDSVISKDHTIDKRPGLPTATSERFSALRSNMSTMLTFNGVRYMLVPEHINGKLYYVNYGDRSYVINQIDLLAPIPTVETFANVRAMDILATNEALYFVNLNSNFGLSKINLATKEMTSLHTGNIITSIKKDAQNVYAYNNDKLVFSEPIRQDVPIKPTIPAEVTAMKQAIEALDHQAITFIQDVATTQVKFSALSLENQALVTNSNQLETAINTANDYKKTIADIEKTIGALNTSQSVEELQVAMKAIRERLKSVAPAIQAGIANVEILNTIEQYIQEQLQQQGQLQEKLKQIEDAIKALDNQSENYLVDVAKVQENISQLAEGQEQLSDDAQQLLQVAVETATSYKSMIATIIAQIDALDKNDETIEEDVVTIRQAIDKAPPAVKAGISNLNVFISIELEVGTEEETIEEVEEITSNIEFLSKEFAKLAEQLLQLIQTLGHLVEQFLSPEAINQVEEIETKYEKMKNLSFDQTTPWKETPFVTKPRKPWTITLSQAVKNTQDNLQFIQVVDMFGDPVDVSIKVDGKTITVTPNADYVADIPYTLVIQPGLENEQGVKLQQGTYLTFTFK